MRHGDALAERLDPERPLSPTGRRDVEEVARLAAGQNLRVSSIFHSGILRAVQTAEMMATWLKPAAGVHPMAGLRPQDDPAIAQAEIALASQPILLVGHLPHLNRLAAMLLTGSAERDVCTFEPASMIRCSIEEARWQISWKINPDGLKRS